MKKIKQKDLSAISGGTEDISTKNHVNFNEMGLFGMVNIPPSTYGQTIYLSLEMKENLK